MSIDVALTWLGTITSTTKQPDDGENSLWQHVLNAVKDQEKNASSFCAGYLAELILNTTTSLFSKREINVSETRTSPLEVFRDTIRDVVVFAVSCINGRRLTIFCFCVA
jgi:hypothetical protein